MRPTDDKAAGTDWTSTDEDDDTAEPIFFSAIDEASVDDNDRITCDGSNGGDTIDFELTNGITDPGVVTGHKIVYRWRIAENGSSACTLTAKLMVGSTVHATDTVNVAGTSGWTTTEHTDNLDSALGSDAAYDNAFLRFEFDDSTDAMEELDISWAYIEVPDAAAAAPAAEPDLPGAAFLMFVD